MIKYFRFTFDFVLWGISWANLTMLLATIPKYDTPDKDPENTDEDSAGIDIAQAEDLREFLKF